MVSVVIPTYGRPDKVKEAIEGALKQTYSDFEIVVVDDNGAGTEKQISTKNIIDSIKSDKIRYVVHEVNKGGCAARNTGIKNSSGEYIAFLDDDDIWSSDYIEEMIKCFTDEKIGAVYCDLYSYDGEYTVTRNNINHPSGNVRKNILTGWCPVSTSLVMVRRSAIVECGMFDENVKSFQDFDMWLSMSSKYEFAYCDRKMLLKFEGIGDQTSVNPKKRQAGFDYICEKWEKTLNDEEKELFSVFKKRFRNTINFKRIVYKKSKGEKYSADLKAYLRSDASFSQKLTIIKRVVLPKRLSKAISPAFSRSDKTKEIIKGRVEGF